MLLVSYAGKNAYGAGKTSGVLRGGASGANRCYVLAHCGMVPYGIQEISKKKKETGEIGNIKYYIWKKGKIQNIHGNR